MQILPGTIVAFIRSYDYVNNKITQTRRLPKIQHGLGLTSDQLGRDRHKGRSPIPLQTVNSTGKLGPRCFYRLLPHWCIGTWYSSPAERDGNCWLLIVPPSVVRNPDSVTSVPKKYELGRNA